MNKAELIEAVATKADLSKADAGRALDALFESISKALKKNDKVSLVGFGTFSVRKRAARQGRNPKTGEEVPIDPRRVLSFRASHVLKEKINKMAGLG